MNDTSHILHIYFTLRYSVKNFVKTLVEILSESPLLPNSPFSPTFWGPSRQDNISSTPLAKFHQNRHFCQICHFRQIRQHFGTLQSRLMYSVERFRQDLWRNFVRVATFAKFTIFAKFVDIWDPSLQVNIFSLKISSITLAKFRQNRHFRQLFANSVTSASNVQVKKLQYPRK